MPVNLRCIDDSGNNIDLTTGLNLGISRKGVPIIQKFKLKNEGDITARDIIITATPQNEMSEVAEDEYNRQQLAAQWKSFSLDNKTFVRQLNVGSVPPNKFVEGIKVSPISFASEAMCQFTDRWSAAVTEFKNDAMYIKKADDGSKGQVAKRMAMNSIPTCCNFEVEFTCDFKFNIEDQESASAFIGFPVRINSKGDGKGYMFFIHCKRDGKFIVSIYKNAKGMTSNVNREYGDKIIDTIVQRVFDKNKIFKFKCYNNTLGQPTFEVWYDGEKLKLSKTNVAGVQGYSISDTGIDAYVGEGNFFIDMALYTGDYYAGLTSMTLRTEEKEQFVYVKNVLGDGAENKVNYKSAVSMSYIED